MLQNMKYAWLIVFLSIASAQAEIYRWVDADGNVVFSDESHPDAEKIDLPESTTYTPVEVEQTTDTLKLSPDEEPEPESLPEYDIRIIAPADDESIWVNNGNVTVNLILEPQLNVEQGHLMVLSLDGTDIGVAQPGTTFQLNNLSRGTHTLTAMVVNDSGGVLSSSDTITFHLHRASVLNKPAQNQAN